MRSPVSVFQVAALLESSGITDALAQQRYNHADVFELARTLAQRPTQNRRPAPLPNDAAFPQESVGSACWTICGGRWRCCHGLAVVHHHRVSRVGQWGSRQTWRPVWRSSAAC